LLFQPRDRRLSKLGVGEVCQGRPRHNARASASSAARSRGSWVAARRYGAPQVEEEISQ
jgi:hypothetical protein